MAPELIKTINDENQQFLSDESRFVGEAASISFPKNEDEIKEIVHEVNKQHLPMTIQGARTGISGGAVPFGGHVMNLSKMERITGMTYDAQKNTYVLSVQPGVRLSQIQKVLREKVFNTEGWSTASIKALEQFQKDSQQYYFASDITETSASIGGMVACNASGARSYMMGAARNFVEEIHLVLADGAGLRLTRGVDKAQGRHFQLKTEDGRLIRGELPDYALPDVKNTAGYFTGEDMDLIDLFIGSEGTLGIITEIKISLTPKAPFIWGVMAFFSCEVKALQFVNAVRSSTEGLAPVAIEYFNHNALDLFRKQKEDNATFRDIPSLKPDFHTAIYVECQGEAKKELSERILRIGEILQTLGEKEEATWVAANAIDLEKLIQFRHAIPESVNMLIGQRKKANLKITKLGTDMAVPDCQLEKVIDIYNASLAESELESVMFGHIGNNHIHVNILPRDMADYHKGKELYNVWAAEIVAMGGTVSAEHGIGKLKKDLLITMIGEQGIDQMKRLKELFDPQGLLNPGTIFS